MQKYIICCILVFLLIFAFSITIITLHTIPVQYDVPLQPERYQAKRIVNESVSSQNPKKVFSQQIADQNLQEKNKENLQKELIEKILRFEKERQKRLNEEYFLREEREGKNQEKQIVAQELETLLVLMQELSDIKVTQNTEKNNFVPIIPQEVLKENTEKILQEEKQENEAMLRRLELARQHGLELKEKKEREKIESQQMEKAQEEEKKTAQQDKQLEKTTTEQMIREKMELSKKLIARKKALEEQAALEKKKDAQNDLEAPDVVSKQVLDEQNFGEPLARVQETIQIVPKNTIVLSNESLFANNDIVAFYGNPNSQHMGVVGQFSLSELEPKLTSYANEYDMLNDERGVIPALYLIYGTCWPKGDIGYLSDKTVTDYIEYALERNWIVILDHQIGKYSIDYAVRRLLPYLKYPNVHLALDPEWRTLYPMEEIGFVTGDEVNEAQRMIENYLNENNYKGKRFLVIHQFQDKMIQRRENIKDFTKVEVVHSADGFGSPRLKKESYMRNARAKNLPLKSFKLFTKPTIEKAGYDTPLMSPKQVLSLDPKPVLIMLQ
ncbi:MAG: hypothetical protein ACRC5H_03030 [Treponemataceae bacterium]